MFKTTYEAVLFAIAKLDDQGGKCICDETHECMYHRNDGARCVVGWMLTEDQARSASMRVEEWGEEELARIAPDAWEHLAELNDLQNIHDEHWRAPTSQEALLGENDIKRETFSECLRRVVRASANISLRSHRFISEDLAEMLSPWMGDK